MSSEVIKKMKTNNLSKKISSAALTLFIVVAVLLVLFGKQFALTVFASTGKVTSTTANVRSSASTSSDAHRHDGIFLSPSQTYYARRIL